MQCISSPAHQLLMKIQKQKLRDLAVDASSQPFGGWKALELLLGHELRVAARYHNAADVAQMFILRKRY